MPDFHHGLLAVEVKYVVHHAALVSRDQALHPAAIEIEDHGVEAHQGAKQPPIGLDRTRAGAANARAIEVRNMVSSLVSAQFGRLK